MVLHKKGKGKRHAKTQDFSVDPHGIVQLVGLPVLDRPRHRYFVEPRARERRERRHRRGRS